jgi:trans-aconitate methyltransferase
LSEARQSWDPEQYARNARFVSDLGEPLLALLSPRAGERVLDVGCGDGVLTQRLREAGCEVVAVDSSAEQVAAARALGLDARIADVRDLPFDAEFDAVLSNAVLHWVKDADAAMACVHRALRSGGRFVAELGGKGCVARIRAALHEALAERGLDPWVDDPWYFPDTGEYTSHLERAGFVIDRIELFDRPTPLPGDVLGWLETFAKAFLDRVEPVARSQFLVEVRDRLAPQLCDAAGRWTADYVRLRFVAHRP